MKDLNERIRDDIGGLLYTTWKSKAKQLYQSARLDSERDISEDDFIYTYVLVRYAETLHDARNSDMEKDMRELR